MKFAFLIMGKFNSETDKAAIHNGVSQLIGVADIEDACRTARNLYENGIDCIEPVSYTHLDVYKRQLPVCLWMPVISGQWEALMKASAWRLMILTSA